MLGVVPAEPENPTAPGHSGPDADGELEGAAVTGEDATTEDQEQAVTDGEEQQDTG